VRLVDVCSVVSFLHFILFLSLLGSLCEESRRGADEGAAKHLMACLHLCPSVCPSCCLFALHFPFLFLFPHHTTLNVVLSIECALSELELADDSNQSNVSSVAVTAA
jgi:hypothetical protein